MEGHFLSGDAFAEEDAAVLLGTFLDDGSKLHLPSHPEREDDCELECFESETVPIHVQGAAGDHP
jgi:hypothetical protein